jgi:hypothetical protein
MSKMSPLNIFSVLREKLVRYLTVSFTPAKR